MTEFLPTTTFPPMNTFAPTVISLSILALLFITAEGECQKEILLKFPIIQKTKSTFSTMKTLHKSFINLCSIESFTMIVEFLGTDFEFH